MAYTFTLTLDTANPAFNPPSAPGECDMTFHRDHELATILRAVAYQVEVGKYDSRCELVRDSAGALCGQYGFVEAGR